MRVGAGKCITSRQDNGHGSGVHGAPHSPGRCVQHTSCCPATTEYASLSATDGSVSGSKKIAVVVDGCSASIREAAALKQKTMDR